MEDFQKNKKRKLTSSQQAKKKNYGNKKFKYGNYNRYYGYRNAKENDTRIELLQKEWFDGKKCLDIGCNVGHLTLWIAKHFQPKFIKGVDIDCELIIAAKNNIVNYVEAEISLKEVSFNEKNTNNNSTTETITTGCKETKNNTDELKTNKNFNDSTTTSNDKVNVVKVDTIENRERTLNNTTSNNVTAYQTNGKNDVTENKTEVKFPYNVKFITENYVPSSEGLLKYVKEEYDTILCLSVTKWIQLNAGDDGLKQMFKKIYKQLHQGGRFILEPQPFSSYKRRKNLTEEIRKNYDNMEFMPDDYVKYLLSDEVGFTSIEELHVTPHNKQGFQRSFYILLKG